MRSPFASGGKFYSPMNQDSCCIGQTDVNVFLGVQENVTPIVVWLLCGCGFGGGGVMVWGGICHGHKTPLVIVRNNLTAQRYRDDILQPFVLRHNVTLQQR